MSGAKQTNILNIFAELALQIREEEIYRDEIKDEFQKTLDHLKQMKPANKAENLLQFEILLNGMTQSLKNSRDYNDKQFIILEDFKKLLEGNNIQ